MCGCGVLWLVVLLPRGMCAKIYECGASVYGVVLVTVMMIFWFGLVCVWTFRQNVGFCGPWITVALIVLVGRWLRIVIGVWHNFSFFEPAYAAWRVWDRRRTCSSFKEKVEVFRNFLKCAVSRQPKVFNLEWFCLAFGFLFAWLTWVWSMKSSLFLFSLLI